MKATISKQTAEGEMIVIECEGNEPIDLGEQLMGALQLTDRRLMEMNRRIVDSHTYVRSLPQEIRGPVSVAVDAHRALLYGVASPAQAQAVQETQPKVDDVLAEGLGDA